MESPTPSPLPKFETSTPLQQDLWVLEHQILPNVYGLKQCALARIIELLKSAQWSVVATVGTSGPSSPLPWTAKFVSEGGYDSLTDAFYIKDSKGHVVADLDKGRDNKPECEHDAALIVRAVNAHSALVEALKACLQMAWTAKPRKLDEALSWVENDEKAREMARAALALAEPKL